MQLLIYQLTIKVNPSDTIIVRKQVPDNKATMSCRLVALWLKLQNAEHKIHGSNR